jgi:hypothetical protein
MSVPGSINQLLIGAAGAGDGNEKKRSLRFARGDSPYLSRQASDSGSNVYKCTLSWWMKVGELGTDRTILSFGTNNAIDGWFKVNLESSSHSDKIRLFGDTTGGYLSARTSRLFRDPSAFYHCVISIDTTQSAFSDQIKWYVNGELLSQFDQNNPFPQNTPLLIGESTIHHVGAEPNSVGDVRNYFDGYLADVHVIEGQALAATDFGEFDSNSVWQPKAFEGTYGTNGFKLNFSDISSDSALGTDSSGNQNNFTVNNLTAGTEQTLPGVNFDGTSNAAYLTIPDSSDFTLGSNDFTVEAYVYKRDTSEQFIAGSADSSGSTSSTSFALQVGGGSPSSSIRAYVGTTGTSVDSGENITLNKWVHVAFVRDGNTLRLYVDGVQKNSTSFTGSVNDSSDLFGISSLGGFTNGKNWNGVISNLRLVNGTCLYPSGTTFALPSTPLTNVTNTKLLCCQSSSSATATTVSPGSITVGNASNVAAVELNDSSSADDALRDSPAQIAEQIDTGVGGEVVGNYATWNPLFGENQSLSNGNLKAASSTTAYSIIASTLAMKSGKWYMEYTYTPNNGQPYITWGISQTNRDGSQGSGVTDTPEDKGFKAWDSGFYSQSDGSNIYDYSSSVSSGDIISLAFDADAGKLWVAKNGTYMTNASGAGNPTAGTNPDYSGLDYSGGYYFMAGPYYTNGSTLEANFGQRSWAFAAPTNFKALCTANLPEPTIADGSKHVIAKLFTGNASTQSITGLNFSPSFVWTKSRSLSYSHRLYDTVRGTNNWLASNLTDEATAESETLTSFDANGFTLGQYDNGNYSNGDTAVAWTWNGGTSNTTVAVGDLNTSVYYMSEVWSEDLYTADAPADAPTVTTKSFLSGYPATLPFNGDTSRGSNETYAADSLKTIVFRPDTALTDVTKLEIYTNGTYTTDAGYNSATSVITGNTATGWQTLYEGTAITLNYVWAYKNNGQGAFSGLKINGRMLTDSDATPPISYPSIASTVRANPSAGFSIVKWTGTGSAATVAHGIAAPKFIITKSLANTTNWVVGHEGITWNNFMFLDTADAQGASAAVWNNTAPDSNVFSVASSSYINPAGSDVIGYCFCPVEGYSVFGSYEGNGLADGPFIYTGFKIEFLIIKSADTAQYWYLADSARSPFNDGLTEGLWANTADSEFSYDVDFLSNGFKHYNQSANLNTTDTFIYAAFASHPFRSARAR